MMTPAQFLAYVMPTAVVLGLLFNRIDARWNRRRSDDTWWLAESTQLKQELKEERAAAKQQREDFLARIQALEADIRALKAGAAAEIAAAVAQATGDLAAKHQAELQQLIAEHGAERTAMQARIDVLAEQLTTRQQQAAGTAPPLAGGVASA